MISSYLDFAEMSYLAGKWFVQKMLYLGAYLFCVYIGAILTETQRFVVKLACKYRVKVLF